MVAEARSLPTTMPQARVHSGIRPASRVLTTIETPVCKSSIISGGIMGNDRGDGS